MHIYAEDLRSLTCEALRDLLRKKGLKGSGNKSELVERLINPPPRKPPLLSPRRIPIPDITWKWKDIEEPKSQQQQELRMVREAGQKNGLANRVIKQRLKLLKQSGGYYCKYCGNVHKELTRAHIGPGIAYVQAALWDKYRKNEEKPFEFFKNKCSWVERCYEITLACRKCNDDFQTDFQGLGDDDVPIGLSPP